jgi:hypothetical protein
MKLYRFSPIKNKTELFEAAEYVAQNATKLYLGVVGDIAGCKIEYLTLFSHYEDEFNQLIDIISRLGEIEEANNGKRVKLFVPLVLKGASIERDGKPESIEHSVMYLRIRKPDPHRMQVGCADFEFEKDDEWDYWQFKDFYGMHTDNPRTITRDKYEMLEFHDPNIDVLAYMVSQ